MVSPWPARAWIALALLLGLALMSPVLGELGGDSAQYLSLAESLLEHGSYRDLHLPDAPLHTHYPPGYPLFLLPGVAVFGRDAFVAQKLVQLGFAALALWLAFRLCRKRLPARHALLVLVLTATGSAWLLQSVRLQSEIPYTCALLGFLLEAERPRPRASRLIAFALCAFLLRTAGLVLLLLLPFANRGPLRPHWARLTLGVAVVLGWVLYCRAFQAGTWSYSDEFLATSGGLASLPGYLWDRLLYQTSAIAELLGDHPWLSGRIVFVLVLVLPVLLGLGRALRRPRLLDVCFLGSFALAVLAPARTHRYLVPWIPVLGIYFVDGLRIAAWHAHRLRPVGKLRHVPMLVVACCALLHGAAVLSLLQSRHESWEVDAPPLLRRELGSVSFEQWEEAWFLPRDPTGQRYARAYGSFLLLLRGVPARVPEDAVLAHRKPRLVAFLTRRRCVPMPEASNAAELRELLTRAGVTHILDGGLFASTRRILGPTREPLGLRELLRVRTARLYEVPPAARPTPR